MAVTKPTGCGTILSVDEAGGSTFIPVTLVANVTPPDQEWTDVEANELASCEDETQPGMAAPSECTFTQYYEPGSVGSELMKTLHEAKTVAAWQIEFPFGYLVTEPTIEFVGYIRRLGPQQVGPNDTIQREVIIRRKGIITDNAGADA